MGHEFKELSGADDTWANVQNGWRAQCEAFEENFDGYATAARTELNSFADPANLSYKVFGLINEDNEECDAVCSVNWTNLPGYADKVLRVRNLLFAPRFDFGEYEVSEYSTVLTRMFARAYGLATGPMPSQHIKFHLRSPAEMQFFALVGSELGALDEFKAVKVRGAWLYVDLA